MVEALGRSGVFLLRALFGRSGLGNGFRLLVKQLFFVGVLSLPIIVVAGLFIGMVQGLAMQWLLAGTLPPDDLARAQADGFFTLYRRSLRPLP